MSDQFVGEIRIFGGNFAPSGWAMCNGQLLLISQNTALFSLLGTNYGGNGQSTFGLPNLQGSAPLMAGQGSGLSLRSLGQIGGTPTVTLLTSELPIHNHSVLGTSSLGDSPDPANDVWGVAAVSRGMQLYSAGPGTSPTMNGLSFTPAGGSLPHNNLSPYLVLTFIIALQGIFPAR